MRHLHAHGPRHQPDQPPATQGRLIRWAKHYDTSVSLLMLGRRARLRQQTVALAGVRAGDRVLEVGCGTGDVALAASALAGPGGAVVGIDPSPEMLAVARSKASRAGRAVDFQLGLIEALAFPDATFDVVLSSLMMHHLPEDLKRQGLVEIARVLKPGGRLLIVDIKRPSGLLGRALLTLALHGGMEHGVQDLLPLLGAAGFAQVEAGDTDFRTLGFVRALTRR